MLEWKDALNLLTSWFMIWKTLVITLFVILLYALSVLASIHILLKKRDPRAALGWVVVCLGFPGLGALFYLIFGINRVKAKGQDLTHQKLSHAVFKRLKKPAKPLNIPQNLTTKPVFHQIKHVADTITQTNLCSDGAVSILKNGEGAYPQMIDAILNAKQSVYLCTYIFDSKLVGDTFIQALHKAHQKGVDVRVLVDGIGHLYSWPSAYRKLKKLKVPTATFLPLSLSAKGLHLNLRNHRKILVIDGVLGFTGGMNIGERHLVENRPISKAVQDLHFKVEGPVVAELIETFLKDWFFATGKFIEPNSVSLPTQAGQALCRGLADGPDKDFEKIRLILIGAISAAQENVRIMTPYFIPDASMISALNAAALKGITVEIILPQTNNLPFVKWASQAYFWELLQYNIKIYYQPAPFAHTKFMVIDDFYSHVGSANLDPRSLRLNFEFNLEVFDKKLASELTSHFDDIKQKSKQLSMADLNTLPLWKKIRDGFFKLFSPYL